MKHYIGFPTNKTRENIIGYIVEVDEARIVDSHANNTLGLLEFDLKRFAKRDAEAEDPAFSFAYRFTAEPWNDSDLRAAAVDNPKIATLLEQASLNRYAFTVSNTPIQVATKPPVAAFEKLNAECNKLEAKARLLDELIPIIDRAMGQLSTVDDLDSESFTKLCHESADKLKTFLNRYKEINK